MLPSPSLVSRLLLLRLFSKLYFILSVVLTILLFAAPALQSFRDGLHQGRLRSAVSWQLPIGAIRRYPKRHQLHRELALPCQGPSGPYLELQPTRPTELLNFLATTVKKKVVMNMVLPSPLRGYHGLSCSHVGQVDRPLLEPKV